MPDKPAEKAAGGAGGIIGKKVGPLPLWAWAAIGGGGMLALRLIGGGGAAKSPLQAVVGQAAPASSSGTTRAAAVTTPASTVPTTSPASTTPEATIPIVQPPASIVAPNKTPIARAVSNIGKTAAELAREPVGGWKSPPLYQQIDPATVVVRDLSTGQMGAVNPKNVLVGYADVVTGELTQDPSRGQAIWR